jgi:hypothetical protein
VQTVVFTPTFETQAKRTGLTEAELFHIAEVIAADRRAGDLIQGSSGARKLRFARTGEGKSGGYRTIHYFAGDDIPVFLLALIDKRERGNLSKTEINQLAAILNQIAASYRGERR